jgi:hypothetical protein
VRFEYEDGDEDEDEDGIRKKTRREPWLTGAWIR